MFTVHVKEGRPTPDWLKTGWGNGYIEIPPGHWLYGLHYDDIEALNPPFNVHGGITYSSRQGKNWVLGFDTAHCYDTPENWPYQKVVQHTTEWAKAFFEWEDPRKKQKENNLNSIDHCEVCAKVQGQCIC